LFGEIDELLSDDESLESQSLVCPAKGNRAIESSPRRKRKTDPSAESIAPANFSGGESSNVLLSLLFSTLLYSSLLFSTLLVSLFLA
jgi:hypothetical protein